MKIVYGLRFLLNQSPFFMRDLEQNFVPSLLQHLECGATELHVYKMTGAVHEKLNILNMCSKQDFIPITLLVIVALLLKVVRNSAVQFLTGKDKIIFRAKSCGTILHNTDATTLSVNNPCCCPVEYFLVLQISSN